MRKSDTKNKLNRPHLPTPSTSFIINSIFWANRLIYRQKSSAHSGALYRFIMSPIQGSSDCLTLTNVEIKSEKRDLLMALTLWAFAMKTVGIGEGLLAFFVYFVHSNLLPLLFTTFPGSFTFGEGCLALQSTIVYAMHSIQMLAHFQGHFLSIHSKLFNISNQRNPSSLEDTTKISSIFGRYYTRGMHLKK